jgi:hypothetical protein
MVKKKAAEVIEPGGRSRGSSRMLREPSARAAP